MSAIVAAGESLEKQQQVKVQTALGPTVPRFITVHITVVVIFEYLYTLPKRVCNTP